MWTSFSLVLLSDRYSYELPVLDPSIFLVILSATPLTCFYQNTVSAIKYSYQLFTWGNNTMCLYQVFYTYLYQLLLSLMGICYPNKLLISDIRITSSYLTTNFLYSYELPYQVSFSAPTFSLLHSSCSDYLLQYSFQLFISASPSYSYQLLLSATCNR